MRRPKDELGTREMPSSVLACRPREGHAPDARHICFQSRISAGERGYVKRGLQGRKEAMGGLWSQMEPHRKMVLVSLRGLLRLVELGGPPAGE